MDFLVLLKFKSMYSKYTILLFGFAHTLLVSPSRPSASGYKAVIGGGYRRSLGTLSYLKQCMELELNVNHEYGELSVSSPYFLYLFHLKKWTIQECSPDKKTQ